LVRDERHDDEREEEQRGDRDPVLPDRKDLLVFGVGRLELPGFSVEHGFRPDR
jgi:hypothetical protein